MIPKFGSKEWFAWKVKFIAEAYELLARNPKPSERRDYDPVFARTGKR